MLEVLPPDELMPYCRKLAAEIVSCDPTTVRRMRGCMKLGQNGTLRDGLALEAKYAKESVLNFDAAAFAARRENVMARGKEQIG